MTQQHLDYTRVTGIILAGGRSQRMGGDDKGLMIVAGKPLIEHVISRIKPQVGSIIISANRHQEQYAALGYSVIADTIGDGWGPLAGMASAMQEVDTPYVLIVPCDVPELPTDLTGRMLNAIQDTDYELGIASDGQRLHPVVVLMRGELMTEMKQSLIAGERKVEAWMLSRRHVVTDYSDNPGAFTNINSPQDIASYEQTHS